MYSLRDRRMVRTPFSIKKTLHVPSLYNNKRLDIFIAETLTDFSRTYIKKLILEGYIHVNNEQQKPHYKLTADDTILLHIPEPETTEILPQNIPLSILHEDESLVIINKQPGIVVHPASGNLNNTIVNALMYHIHNFNGINGSIRPGIVHRLDKDTSGCLIIAKNDRAHHFISSQFKKRTIQKKYLALVGGTISNDTGTINNPIGRHPVARKKMSINYNKGRDAETTFSVKARFSCATFVEILPKTGRTHQIRVHFSSLGNPILGDTVYGKKYTLLARELEIKRQLLHASQITFLHPRTEKEITITAPLPPDMITILDFLKQKLI
ncbi:RluA family pseudouridine synthase [Chlamydiota bacterium]